jgi:hypothetical protein
MTPFLRLTRTCPNQYLQVSVIKHLLNLKPLQIYDSIRYIIPQGLRKRDTNLRRRLIPNLEAAPFKACL